MRPALLTMGAHYPVAKPPPDSQLLTTTCFSALLRRVPGEQNHTGSQMRVTAFGAHPHVELPNTIPAYAGVLPCKDGNRILYLFRR